MWDKLRRRLRAWLGVVDAVPEKKPESRGISSTAMTLMKAGPPPRRKGDIFQLPELPDGVIGKNPPPEIVMDDGCSTPPPAYALAYFNSFGGQVLGFPGYAYLADKARISEFRNPSETIASEMTRRWLTLKTTGGEDRSTQIEEMTKAIKTLNVRECFQRALEQTGLFGRSQIFPRLKNQDGVRHLPLVVAPESIKKGDLLGFKVIEPYWTSPLWYNTTDPTDEWFYVPMTWWIMGRATHATRLLTFIFHELPDLFKAAYNFSGLSITQLMQPDVFQWLRTRDAVSDTIFNYSTTVLATNMQATLSGGDGSDTIARMQMFNANKSNAGLMMIDKSSEELQKVQTSLAGLDELQAQAQEHQCAPSKIPLVKLTGVTPSGLNASSDGEIQMWNDEIAARQTKVCDPHITVVLRMIQCHLFGKIYDDITHVWEPLEQLDGEALARVRKSDADAGVAYIAAGVVAPEEERERLANDPNSAYVNLDPQKVPDPPVDPNIDAAAEAEARLGKNSDGGDDE